MAYFLWILRLKLEPLAGSGYQTNDIEAIAYFRNHHFKESKHLIKTIILTFSNILDLQILLEQAENRGQRALPGLPSTVLRESGRLQAPHI